VRGEDRTQQVVPVCGVERDHPSDGGDGGVGVRGRVIGQHPGESVLVVPRPVLHTIDIGVRGEDRSDPPAGVQIPGGSHLDNQTPALIRDAPVPVRSTTFTVRVVRSSFRTRPAIVARGISRAD
jgi:hypothetical protein